MRNRTTKSTLVGTLKIMYLLHRHIGEVVPNTVEAVGDDIPLGNVRNGLWSGNLDEISFVVRENMIEQVAHE